jgi:hypothetical protein
LDSVLSKRRLANWSLTKINYVPFPSRYDLIFSNGTETKAVNLVSELFDDVESAGSGNLRLRKIKNLLKQTLTPGEPLE